MSLASLVTKKFGEDLTKSTDIEELILDDIGVIHELSKEDKAYLENFKTITTLTMCGVGLRSLANWPHLPSIVYLSLNENELESGLEELGKAMPGIIELDIEKNHFKDIKALTKLVNLSKLESINMKENPVTKTVSGYKEELFKELANLDTVDRFDKAGNEYMGAFEGELWDDIGSEDEDSEGEDVDTRLAELLQKQNDSGSDSDIVVGGFQAEDGSGSNSGSEEAEDKKEPKPKQKKPNN